MGIVTRYPIRNTLSLLSLRSCGVFRSQGLPPFSFSSTSTYFSRPAMKMHTEVLADRLEKPLQDDREYRVIRLPNKLEALLIHDAKTDKASAAVDVNVGSLSDEHDLPGMAHAVEHMLFMGNDKYPEENDYQQYLAAHSGSHNAYTAQTSTNYFFEMGLGSDSPPVANGSHPAVNGHSEEPSSPVPFYGALDRFSQFFVSPLFLEDSLDRELRAVDSENKKNLQSDVWRIQQLRRSLSNPDHPNNKFSTGNLQTLRDDPVARGVQIRKEFIRFYDENYSANRMKLAVLGRESLDQLQAWVEELFGGVRNKELDKLRWDIPLLTENELLTETFAKSIMDSRKMELIFPYPDEEPLWDSSPGRYISHLIGHEGPGSILAHIKEKGWANGLFAGSRTLCPGTGTFEISISLTPEGLQKYEQIVTTIFEYISILHESPPQEWIHEELRRMGEVEFRFQQKRSASSTASGLAQSMQLPVPRENLMSVQKVRRFDPEAIKNGMKSLNPDNFRLFIVSKQDLPGEAQREKWYGTEYLTRKFSDNFKRSIHEAFTRPASQRTSSLSLPGHNEFIPTKLEVEKKSVETPMKYPKLIRNDANVRLWHKKDDQFWIPKANVFLRLRDPICGLTPRNNVMSLLFTQLVEDALEQYAYDAEIAGLGYSLDATQRGMNINLAGYNDKMPILLERVLSTIRNLEIKNNRFEIIKENISRNIRNKAYSTPYLQVGEFSRWLTKAGMWITHQLAEELDHVSPDDIRNFKPLLLSQMHIEVLAHGNLYREEALKLADLIERTLQPQTLPSAQWPIDRTLLLPPGSNFLYLRELPDPANVNHVIEYLLQIGEASDRKRRAMTLLLEQMGKEPAFDRLRTKEQLGYVVFSGSTKNGSVLYYRIIVQSERTPDYLEQRIESFLRSFKKELLDMTPEKFESHRRSKINERLERVKNLSQESGRFWQHISNEVYHFDELEDDVVHLKSLTKEDMIDFFNYYIDPGSPTRAKTSVFMVAQGIGEAETNGDANPAQLKTAFIELLGQYLSTKGLNVDEDKLHMRFKNVKVSDGDQKSVLTALLSYVKEDVKLPQNNVSNIEEEVKLLLGPAFARLGIKSTSPDSEKPPVDNTPVKQGTIIDDVHAFKASMPLTAGPIPIRPLSAYEDLEPKL